jgi:alpha-L-rhamnosidase
MKQLATFLFFLFWLAFSHPNQAQSAFHLASLKTEYATTPLGLDIPTPRFSWQMTSLDSRRGLMQKAWQIAVSDESGLEVWNSGKIESEVSLGVYYQGQALQPTTRYTWKLTVWDQDGRIGQSESWFEMGLMNPTQAAWSGAQWIGGGDSDLNFYSHYFSVFKIAYRLQLDEASQSKKASFVFGANDRRLMDRNKNIMGVQAAKDQSFIRFELDISGLEASSEGQAQLHIFRVGYDRADRPDVPLKSLSIPREQLHSGNRYEPQDFRIESNFGIANVFLGTYNLTQNEKMGQGPFAGTGVNLNPVGVGNNYVSYPMINDIGFHVDSGQKAVFSKVEIRNFRFPSNLLFQETFEKTYKGIFSTFLQNTSSGLSLQSAGLVVEGKGKPALALVDPSQNAAPMLRTVFSTQNKKIKKARLYVTARGIYELYLNGQRVGQDYFNPGLTQYNKTHMYQTFDVTDQIKSGQANALGAWLSEGWWSGNITFQGENWNFFGDRQSLLSKLVLTYEDGTTELVRSQPETWQVYLDGPVRYGSFFQGEVYDATKEKGIEGWAEASYLAKAWKPAVAVLLEGTAYIGTFQVRNAKQVVSYENMKLTAQLGDNARVVKILKPKSVEEVRPGVFVYDMGQNMVGIPRLQIKGGTPGQELVLRFAEVRYPKLQEHGEEVGMIMLENIRAALAQDVWKLKGGDETVQPRFTFHGYRYLEITGIDQALPLDAVEGLVISSIGEITSSYVTSNPLVNRFWENITWSLRGNFLSIPTDTPARNERMGWSGDINVFARASTFLSDADLFLRRHMIAMRDLQREDGRFADVAPVGGGFGGTLWGSAGIILPWEVYRQYGDLEILKENYEGMKRYVEFLDSKVDPNTGIINEGPLGDWLSPENAKNDNTMLWTAYQVYDLEILANTAELLGKSADAALFRQKRETRKAFLNQKYLDAAGKSIKSGLVVAGFGSPPPSAEPQEGKPVDTQASYAVPLHLNAIADDKKAAVSNHLFAAVERQNVDDSGVLRPSYSLMTGFIGTASINEALSEAGRHDLAYRLLQQTSYPSWLYPVINGATTIWERLNSYTVENGFGGNNSMNSFNHYSFGAVGAWMYTQSLGIQRDPKVPAFKQFILQPTPDPTGQMTFAEGHVETPYGRIESSWKMEGKKFTYKATVPANTTATLFLPASSLDSINEGGKALDKATGLKFVRMENGKAVIELSSGKYEFVSGN